MTRCWLLKCYINLRRVNLLNYGSPIMFFKVFVFKNNIFVLANWINCLTWSLSNRFKMITLTKWKKLPTHANLNNSILRYLGISWCYHMHWLITLSVITLHSFHCIFISRGHRFDGICWLMGSLYSGGCLMGSLWKRDKLIAIRNWL